MNKVKGIELGNTPPSVLFSTEEERQEAKMPKVEMIPLELIDSFKNHPFYVRDDEDMAQLVESVKINGVLTPVILRFKTDGRYELISGHRRKHASEIAERKELPAEVRSLTDEEATILMVESNVQRTTILPSEKAFAYKMRLDAMKRQGKRTDLTPSPVATKSNNLTSSPVATESGKGRADDELAKSVGEGKDNIRRYIRLTELIPDLLEMVDKGKLKFRPAVDLSCLNKSLQKDLYEVMQQEKVTPSGAQAAQLKKAAQEEKLNRNGIELVLQAQKPASRKLTLKQSDGLDLIPQDLSEQEQENFVVEALKYYVEYVKLLESEQA